MSCFFCVMLKVIFLLVTIWVYWLKEILLSTNSATLPTIFLAVIFSFDRFMKFFHKFFGICIATLSKMYTDTVVFKLFADGLLLLLRNN